ncbi:MAG: alpha-glucan family phosphorylase [Akkermansiaceae bacterium]
MSFLPEPYQHPYEIDPKYSKSAVYFSSEFAIDQALKIYSGGLGFLAGSHMRSAYDLKQNLIGIGILWSYGYYDQGRDEHGEMGVMHNRKPYHFLQDTGIKYTIKIHDHDVWVKALYLPAETFGTAPMFFLTTDLPENDVMSQTISHRLYDADFLTRTAQYLLLGKGGATLLDVLGVDPEVWHLNEAHALSAAFHVHQKYGSLEEVKKRFVFTTHTPVEAGNEKSSFDLLNKFTFFSGMDAELVKELCAVEGDVFSHSLAALRLSHKSNAVSKLHGEVSREMWKGHEGICEIDHVTNAQNKKYWVDPVLEEARLKGDTKLLAKRKRELKVRLFKEVADQTGKLLNPDHLTVVWARRFAGYKRADLITRDIERFEAILKNTDRPVQLIWAGKPYPKDYGAIYTFNHLIELTEKYANATVVVGYELALSKLLKDGSDIWLNNPVVTLEASGTSGMTAAMNASVNFSTYDGWICEFAKHGHNSFIIPEADTHLAEDARDLHDMLGFYQILETMVLPSYYENPDSWWEIVLNSMNEVIPFFDSGRMADDYYTKMYSA